MERKRTGNEDLRYFARTLARQAELSQQTVQSLAESSSTVNLTDEEFRGIGGLLNQSRVILTKYGRREVTEKFLILLALIFFYSCVVYVVSKRFIPKITY
jgi:protein transport protein SEC20